MSVSLWADFHPGPVVEGAREIPPQFTPKERYLFAVTVGTLVEGTPDNSRVHADGRRFLDRLHQDKNLFPLLLTSGEATEAMDTLLSSGLVAELPAIHLGYRNPQSYVEGLVEKSRGEERPIQAENTGRSRLEPRLNRGATLVSDGIQAFRGYDDTRPGRVDGYHVSRTTIGSHFGGSALQDVTVVPSLEQVRIPNIFW